MTASMWMLTAWFAFCLAFPVFCEYLLSRNAGENNEEDD